MYPRVCLGVAVLAVASIAGPFDAAAQSAAPSAFYGSVALRNTRVSEAALPDAWPASPQQVERDRTRGALWGGGIGLVGGGLLGGLTVGSDDESGLGGSLTESAATGEAVLFGAVVGAGIGALLGATIFAPAHSSGVVDGGGMSLTVHPKGAAIALLGRVRIGR